MEEYINILKDYLNGRMTWDDVIYLTGGTN